MADLLQVRFLRRASRIYEATDPVEYDNLTGLQRKAYDRIISMTFVDLAIGTRSRNELWTMFPEGTITRAGLESLLPAPPVEE